VTYFKALSKRGISNCTDKSLNDVPGELTEFLNACLPKCNGTEPTFLCKFHVIVNINMEAVRAYETKNTVRNAL
jgi:hypothetical protein